MHGFFCGKYYKCQSDTYTLAAIEASHGKDSSVQVICDDGAWSFTDIGGSRFSENGFELDLHGDGTQISGKVSFNELTPIKYDIMGPFKYVPFMQCRHCVVSMHHRVDGEINVNGRAHRFDGAAGYIEGDRGKAFPESYVWTQSFFDGGSLMLSVASIPLVALSFTGVIAIVMINGKEYRLASYLGARAARIADGEVVIRQGKYRLTAKLIERRAHPLKAPTGKDMLRTIHESASCRAYYRFEENGRVLLETETDRASFEYEYAG